MERVHSSFWVDSRSHPSICCKHCTIDIGTRCQSSALDWHGQRTRAYIGSRFYWRSWAPSIRLKSLWRWRKSYLEVQWIGCYNHVEQYGPRNHWVQYILEYSRWYRQSLTWRIHWRLRCSRYTHFWWLLVGLLYLCFHSLARFRLKVLHQLGEVKGLEGFQESWSAQI